MSTNFIDGWLKNLVRPTIWTLIPYAPATRRSAAAAEKIARLDRNEFPFNTGGLGANHYEEQQPQNLKLMMAHLYDVSLDHLLLTRGSTDGIEVLTRVFCRDGIDNVIICPPTYGYYEHVARLQGAAIISVPLAEKNGYQLDVEKILHAATDTTKIIFIPSPNNPLGHQMAAKDVFAICESRREKSIIVVDEAYVDFTSDPKGLSDALSTYDNLVILRTLSKAYGLAGDRFGSILGHPRILEMAQKVLPPFLFPPPVISDVLKVLSDGVMITTWDKIIITINERDRLARTLRKSPDVETVFPSAGNFVTVRVKGGNEKDFLAKAAMNGFELRGCTSHGMPGCVRITIGTPEQNMRLLRLFVPNSDIELAKPHRRSAKPAILKYWGNDKYTLLQGSKP